jgi:hypothetical protein
VKTPPLYFRAAQIAKVAALHARTIKRLAKKQGWQYRRRGNALEFVPPAALRAKCQAALSEISAKVLDGFNITVSDQAAVSRAFHRFAALSALDSQIKQGQSVETALLTVAPAFNVSVSGLRRWLKHFIASGFAGLLEQRRGRSGRKPKAQA